MPLARASAHGTAPHAAPRHHDHTWHGLRLRLLPHGGVLLRDHATLLIADPHFGKAACFRAAGVPLPRGTTAQTLARLDHALDDTHNDNDSARVEHLVVLGDFFHARAARQPDVLDALAAWRDRQATLRITLVRGNHDRHAGDPPPALRINVADPPHRLALDTRHAITCCHSPEEAADVTPSQAPDLDPVPAFAGHVHPAVRLQGPGRQHLRVPCFHFGPGLALLPAFGAFTGTHPVRPRPGDAVFLCDEQHVVPIATP